MPSCGVLIRGDGIAARCCGHLLRLAGYRVAFEPVDRPRVPVIMLSDAAQNLIRDIFQKDDLFRDLPVIRKRVVAWGSHPVELDHSAVVLSEEELLHRLGMISWEADTGWTICSTPPLPAEAVERRFGSRMAAVIRVEMKDTTLKDACWIEAVESGWLFLNSGWLLAAGASPEELLAQSKLIREQVVELGVTSKFPASPRMVMPLGGDRWIACGSAAMGFDPLCGDGTAHAVREAILASAVIRAADRGEPVEDLLCHYEARLTAGFHRHLGECLKFYSLDGEWWRAQVQACVEGLEWCHGGAAGFRYRLEGLELKRVIGTPLTG